jgi:hypothetical protein
LPAGSKQQPEKKSKMSSTDSTDPNHVPKVIEVYYFACLCILVSSKEITMNLACPLGTHSNSNEKTSSLFL